MFPFLQILALAAAIIASSSQSCCYHLSPKPWLRAGAGEWIKESRNQISALSELYLPFSYYSLN